jgi:putative flippase GtrA
MLNQENIPSVIIKQIDARKETLRYIWVGIAGAIIDFIIFYLAIYFAVPVLAAQWLGALTGFTHNHLWQHFKVFDHNQRLRKTYSLSLIISVISIALSGPLLVFLDSYIHYYWVSKIIILFGTFLILYSIRRRWIFINKE